MGEGQPTAQATKKGESEVAGGIEARTKKANAKGSVWGTKERQQRYMQRGRGSHKIEPQEIFRRLKPGSHTVDKKSLH